MSVALSAFEEVRPLGEIRGDLLPVPLQLETLFPGGGLRRGSVVSVVGSTSLLLSLLAAASADGAWCAAVGLPALGALAAAERGIGLERFALVPDPGPQWPAVVAALLDGIDVVALSPALPGRASHLRRLAARVRERRAVLLASGPVEGADLRLTVAGSRWEGLGQGHGRLRVQHLPVRAEGRGAAARPRHASVELGPIATGRAG